MRLEDIIEHTEEGEERLTVSFDFRKLSLQTLLRSNKSWRVLRGGKSLIS